MSALCHFQTHASQQSKPYSITSSARGEHRCRQIEAERLGGFQIDHQLVCTGRSAGFAPALISAIMGHAGAAPTSASSSSKDEVCRAVLAGASASVKSDAKCPRCLALHFW